LALDALEMALTKPHIDAFAIVSGDSDFISLVEKLKQYNKTIYIVGGRAFTSTILQKNCREFISYETLLSSPAPSTHRPGRTTQRTPPRPAGPVLPLSHIAPLLYRTMEVLARREVTPQLGLLKSTLQQLDSSFTERDYGASSFRQFVEMLQKAGILELKRVGSQFIVELPQAEEAAPVTDTLLRPEEALPALYQALKVIDENDLWGQLDFNAVRNYVQSLDSEFDERRYGFGQFAEVLTYAQDVGLVRLEPDAESVLRVFPGVQFTPTRPMLPSSGTKLTPEPPPAETAAIPPDASNPAGSDAAEEPPAPVPQPRRRTYRRHSRKRPTPRHGPPA
ncbi:MAG: NYN domain-containing protein, partial [Acidobacteria bacterium]|nr:NYN domain-containing protein [Acidobacteriota bacterium]